MKRSDVELQAEFAAVLRPIIVDFWARLEKSGAIHGSDVDEEDLGAALGQTVSETWTAALSAAGEACDKSGFDCNCFDSIRRLPGGDAFGN